MSRLPDVGTMVSDSEAVGTIASDESFDVDEVGLVDGALVDLSDGRIDKYVVGRSVWFFARVLLVIRSMFPVFICFFSPRSPPMAKASVTVSSSSHREFALSTLPFLA